MEAQHGQGGKQPERKMELEVSKKIREAIKAKLLELGSHIDEELPDYVMILIANRRTVPQMETDLSLFLGDSAKKFVSWLTHVLKKLDRVTSVPGQKSEDDGAGTGSSSKSKSKKTSKGKKSGKQDGSGSSSKAETRSARKIAKHRRSKHSESSVTTSRVETQSVVTSSTEDLPSCTISSTKSTSESVRRLRSKSKDAVEKNEDKDTKPDSSKGESSKENISAPRFKLTMKQQAPRDKKPKKRSALDLDDEHEDEGRSRPRLTLLSDDEQSPVKNAPSKADDDQESDSTRKEESTAQVERVNQPENSQKGGVQSQSSSDLQTENEAVSQPDEPDTHIDTLILNTEENEFADNVEELRRIALESQERKRHDRGTHQKKLITGILMSNKDSFKDKTDKRVTRSSVHESRSSKVENSPRISSLGRRDSKESTYPRPSRDETPPKTVRSPRKSVFDRLSKNSKRESSRDMKSRSRSRSPVRKLTSTIGNVINRSTSVEEVTVRPSVNSVVRVTDRPKRDLKMNNKLLLLAVQDAQKSIIQTEQRSSKVEDKTRLRGKRSNEENRDANEVPRNKDKSIKSRLQFRERESTREQNLEERATLKRFHEFPEVNTEEFFEPTDAENRRKSIKERLGVRRERRPVKDRLGVVQNSGTPEKEETTTDQYEFNDEDFNIVINVNGTVEQRNVTLAASAQAELDNKQLNRISIRVNDSEEEDSSEDDYESSENENGRSAKEKASNNRSAKRDSGSVDGDEVVCVVNDDDRLPDPESDVEYIVEEIEIEEGSDASEGARTDILEPAVSILDMSPKIEHRSTERSDNASSSEDSQLTVRIGELANNNFPSYPHAIPMREANEYRPIFVPTVSSRPVPQGTSQSQSQCKFWPNCQFKDNCIYEHPKCKFNPCTKTQCVYKHSNPIVYKPLPENPSKKKVCKFYPKCTSMSCKFFHPSPCRFGVGCTAAGCQNFHPGVTIGMQSLRAKGKTVIPKVNELKWVKK